MTSSTSTLRVQPPGPTTLSAAARAFNLQLVRIDKLKAQLAELDALGQTQRDSLQTWVHPLRLALRQARRDIALSLAGRLNDKALSRLQRDTALAVLCQHCEALAEAGDAEMAVLHDRHSPLTLAQKKKAAADAMRARLEQVLGAPLAQAGENVSMEELLQAGMRRLRESLNGEQDQKRAARKARKTKPAAASAASAQQQDADGQLRSLFRQLASALHPDRETDPQERLRKTALMSEANAAYGRKDLVTLMQIQLRAELADPEAVSRLADDKLASLTLLLKQQVADLERERAARQSHLAHELELAPGVALNANTLKQALLAEVDELERALARLQHDLQGLGDDALLKRWLNQQRQQSPLPRADRELDDFF